MVGRASQAVVRFACRGHVVHSLCCRTKSLAMMPGPSHWGVILKFTRTWHASNEFSESMWSVTDSRSAVDVKFAMDKEHDASSSSPEQIASDGHPGGLYGCADSVTLKSQSLPFTTVYEIPKDG